MGRSHGHFLTCTLFPSSKLTKVMRTITFGTKLYTKPYNCCPILQKKNKKSSSVKFEVCPRLVLQLVIHLNHHVTAKARKKSFGLKIMEKKS